jgi:hypothetical protein
MAHDAKPVIPWWQHWLLPVRPGMTQFLTGAICLVLPVAARSLGPEWMLMAMAIAATVGGGLGVGWLLANGLTWLRVAPVTSIAVFAMALGCLGHLYLMPRWEVVLRATQAFENAALYLHMQRTGHSVALPVYDAGPLLEKFRLVEPNVPGGVILYTPDPLQRWSLTGYHDSCYLVVNDAGTFQMLATLDQLKAALAGLH